MGRFRKKPVEIEALPVFEGRIEPGDVRYETVDHNGRRVPVHVQISRPARRSVVQVFPCEFPAEFTQRPDEQVRDASRSTTDGPHHRP